MCIMFFIYLTQKIQMCYVRYIICDFLIKVLLLLNCISIYHAERTEVCLQPFSFNLAISRNISRVLM